MSCWEVEKGGPINPSPSSNHLLKSRYVAPVQPHVDESLESQETTPYGDSFAALVVSGGENDERRKGGERESEYGVSTQPPEVTKNTFIKELNDNSILPHALHQSQAIYIVVDRLQRVLQEAEKIYESRSRLISYNGPADSLDQLYLNVISKLLSALQGEDAAYSLHSPPATETDDVELWNINVWKAVLNLIATIPQTTPPASVHPIFDGTSVRSTFLSQKGSEQTRELMNSRIFEEICHCTFRDVGGFFSKYFEKKKTGVAKQISSGNACRPEATMAIRSNFLMILHRTMSLPDGFIFKKIFSQNHAASTTPRRAKQILLARRRSGKLTFF
ncbi:hypothetical protein AJ78_07249 [Emergomyces pasteurianus Ep9510]|uniref:Uncharacterized protein n=1 Tax=Emergomyces pasteurianus Ep9510 TaxID=1447872 RepID=A0A1J9Q835_9EURO|nr:hypothetical protein AJ78_07249 [Emergomyces pasteurianus Ep9510]